MRRYGLNFVAPCLVALLVAPPPASASWGAYGDGAHQTALRSQALDLSRAGNEVTRRLFVSEDRTYTFDLHLAMPDKDERGGQKLLRDVRSGKDANPVKAVLAMPLRLKISIVEPVGERIVIDRELSQQQVNGIHGDAVWARIGRIELQPGFYRLSVQSRKDSPELAHATASLEVSWARRASSSQGSAEMSALLAQVRNADLLSHLSNLEKLSAGTTDRIFLRTESFVIPDEIGVLDPCSHRVHLHRESGNFWIVRRCTHSGVEIFRGAQPGLSAAPLATRALAFMPR